MDEERKNSLMIQTLSEGLSRMHNRTVAVHRIERKPYLESTSFPAERIKAKMDDGTWIDLFFKDLHPDHLLDKARALRKAGMERSRREYRMYTEVLARLRLGTPRLYGSRWSPEEGLCWIFLEDAGPYPLRQIGDFSRWLDAARWAARLHALNGPELHNVAGFLPQLEAAHFELCRNRIRQNRSRFHAGQWAILAPALDYFCSTLDQLTRLPRHLIHGEFFGKNIVIRPDNDREAVAVTDWESAAWGPRCVDLVSLISGKWTTEQRTLLITAYLDQYAMETGERPDQRAIGQELALVSLYRALWWIGYWSKMEGDAVDGWIRELDAVMSRYSIMRDIR